MEIENIERIVDESLGKDTIKRKLFDRLYKISSGEGKLKIPEEMVEWTTKTFGPIEEVEHQKIIRIKNIITMKESLFNPLRSKRPKEKKELSGELRERIETCQDSFSKPLKMTPKDSWGYNS